MGYSVEEAGEGKTDAVEGNNMNSIEQRGINVQD